MPSTYGQGVYGAGTYGTGDAVLDHSFRAKARKRRPPKLQLQSNISITGTAMLTAPPVDLQLSALIPFTATAQLGAASPDLQLSALIPFDATVRLAPEVDELQLETLVAMDNVATVVASATLALDSQVAMDNTATIIPSATLALDSQVSFTETAELHEETVQLALSSTVGMTNTARVATSIKAQSTVSMTNKATLRGSLALQAKVSMTNTAAIAGGASNVVVIPSGIDHTGATDVTAALQFVIDFNPDGTEFVVPNPTWRYRVDGTLTLNGRHDLTFTNWTLEQPPSGVLIDAHITDEGLRINSPFAHFPTRLQNAQVSGPGIPPGTTADYLSDHFITLSQACTPGTGLRVEINLYELSPFFTITDGSIQNVAGAPQRIISNAGTTDFDALLPEIDGAYVTGTGIPFGTTVTYVNNPHVLNLNQTCTIGNGLTIQFHKALRGDLLRGFWYEGNCQRITWTGGTYRGAHICGGTSDAAYIGALEAQHAWTHVQSTEFDVGDNYVEQIYGDFNYAANFGTSPVVSSGRIHDNTFLRNGRQGISLQGVDGIEIDHNDISEIRRSMFDLEPNNPTQFVFNVEIHHNTFGSRRLNFLSATGGEPATPFDNINVHDNTSSDNFVVVISGIDLLTAATAALLPAWTYNNGTAGVGATLTANANGILPPIDGIDIPVGGRFLLRHGLQQAYGPYRVTNRGSATTPWVVTRWTGADQASEIAGATFWIRSGDTLAHTGWHFHPVDPGGGPLVIGTSPLFNDKRTDADITLPALTRTNFRFVDNISTQVLTGSGGAVGLNFVDGITVTGNTQPLAANLVMASLKQCTNYEVSGNTIPGGAGQLSSDTGIPGMRPIANPLYGLTFDSDAGATGTKIYPQELALTTLPRMPFVRFVCDPGEAPSRYSAIVFRYQPYAYLMCMPADSTALKKYTNGANTVPLRNAAIAAYKKRFDDYLDVFEDTVDLWESGNELGGKWTFDNSLGQAVGQQLVADMVTAAHNSVKARGKQSVITLWENDWGTNNCGDGTNMEMNPATFSALLPATVRHNVDYLFVSWYPTQCTANGNPINPIVPVAKIKASMQALHLLYPNAWIGFGEVGLPLKVSGTTLASAKAIANYYYNLDLDLRYFVGGYFWWYAQDDAIPVQTSPMFDTLQAAMGPAPRLEFPVGFAPGAGLPTKVGAGFLTSYPELDSMRDHGAKFVRLTYGWDAADATHTGTFVANTALQDVVGYCNTIGLDVILTFGFSGTAPWQNSIYSYIPQYAASAVGCAAFFDGTDGKKLLALELGNEPNHDKADSTVIGSQKGAKYAELLIRVFDPLFGDVRSVAACDVIVGGLGGEAASGNGIDSFTFTKNVHGVHTVAGHAINVTLLSHYDGWNAHPYTYYTQPLVDVSGGWDNLKQIMAWFQTTYGATPPLWVTEFGWPTDQHLNTTTGVNPSYGADCFDAATALEDMARLLDMSGWDVRCFAWFAFMNNNKPPGPGVGHDNYFGVLEYNTDFTAAAPKLWLTARFATVATRGPN